MDDTNNPQIRDPKTGRMLKGSPSLNPGGRPRLDDVSKEMLIAAVPKCIKAYIDALGALDADNKEDHPTRIKAADALLNRYLGKARQEITGEDGEPIRMGVLVLPVESAE